MEAVGSFWDSLTPYAVTGLNPGVAPATTTAPPLSRSSGPGQASGASGSPIWHPEHPFFWFAVIAGATVGLIGANAHLRVGKAKAGVDVGTG
jgi:hypothetical protein